MFIVRDIRPKDRDDLFRLATMLNTINLPAEMGEIDALIDRSVQSFAATKSDRTGQYVFALEDLSTQRVIGTSMIIAEHGTPADPHHYLRVDTDERYSAQIERVFRHETLTFRRSYTPHTELGGLVLDPTYRGHPWRLGKLLSFVRFVYIALHRERFQDRVQAELLPPFEPDGSSRLWEALGRKFTGLHYEEADRLSRHDPDFIKELFPTTPIYLSLLPDEVRRAVGQVGPGTKGVERMLVEIGFRFNGNLDPFDGGPHYEAHTGEISLVRDAFHLRMAVLAASGDGIAGVAESGIIARSNLGTAEPFRATTAAFERRSGRVHINAAAAERVGAKPDDVLSCTPVRNLAPVGG